MKEFIEKKLNLIIAGVVIVALIAIGIPLSLNTVQTNTGNSEIETVVSTTEAPPTTESEETEPGTELSISSRSIKKPKAKPSHKKKKAKIKKEKSKDKKTKAKEKAKTDNKEDTSTTGSKKKTPAGFSYATAPKQANVSYKAQWNAGYLVAIDNPDKNYNSGHIELSDYDRDLLERLCYGEFGDGGFVGAALVAQAVKDSMKTYGIKTVKDVIKQFSYDGRTDIPGNKTIKDAVTYVFDMDKAAVQHRIIYMYDTKYVDSAFHETQNYVCTFKTTRFFDKK